MPHNPLLMCTQSCWLMNKIVLIAMSNEHNWTHQNYVLYIQNYSPEKEIPIASYTLSIRDTKNQIYLTYNM